MSINKSYSSTDTIVSAYTGANTRNYYKGTSFQFNPWEEGVHYEHDDYIIDFASYKNVFVACKSSHTSSDDNCPNKFFKYNENHDVIGLETNEFWEFVLTGAAGTSDNNYTDADKAVVDWVYEQKEDNKQLSKNDYTDSDKNKLSELPNNSELQSQLEGKQDKLAFDNIPTEDSSNPVKSSGIYNALSNKVDKEEGKGLSTNDFTNEDKSKIDLIPYFKGNFNTWEEVPNSASEYPNPLQKNDYICVKDVSGRIVNYDANSSYLKGQMVLYENLSETKVYECKEAAPVGATPLMTQYWEVREDLSVDFSGSWRFYLTGDFVDKWSWEPQYELGGEIKIKDVQPHEIVPPVTYATQDEVDEINAKIPDGASSENKMVATATMNAALAGKVDKDGNKVLSDNNFTDTDKEKLQKAVEDVPSSLEGVLFGRTKNHVWEPVILASGLFVVLTLPSGATPSNWQVVITYADNTTRHITYVDGGITITDIPAGIQVRVRITPPTGYTCPRSAVYVSQLGVTYNYTGQSRVITDGVYILNKAGNYTEYHEWNTADNNDAVGVGYYQVGGESFVVAKNQASTDFIKNGTTATTAAAFFAGASEGYAALGLTTADVKEDAISCTIEQAARNCEILCELHKNSQPNWETDDAVDRPTTVGISDHFPAAVMAARFQPCVNDQIGDWFLGSAKAQNLCNSNTDINAAMNKIEGKMWVLQLFYCSAIPLAVGNVWYERNNNITNSTYTTYFVVKPFRRF